jgi:hypothetical protein
MRRNDDTDVYSILWPKSGRHNASFLIEMWTWI